MKVTTRYKDQVTKLFRTCLKKRVPCFYSLDEFAPQEAFKNVCDTSILIMNLAIEKLKLQNIDDMLVYGVFYLRPSTSLDCVVPINKSRIKNWCVPQVCLVPSAQATVAYVELFEAPIFLNDAKFHSENIYTCYRCIRSELKSETNKLYERLIIMKFDPKGINRQ